MARNVNLSGGNHEGMQVSQIGQKEDLFRRDVHLQRTLHQLVLFEHREFSVLAPIHLIQTAQHALLPSLVFAEGVGMLDS